MGKALTFSVGIPTFNQADFLEQTILSLLNQKRPADEIVISDHGSNMLFIAKWPASRKSH